MYDNHMYHVTNRPTMCQNNRRHYLRKIRLQTEDVIQVHFILPLQTFIIGKYILVLLAQPLNGWLYEMYLDTLFNFMKVWEVSSANQEKNILCRKLKLYEFFFNPSQIKSRQLISVNEDVDDLLNVETKRIRSEKGRQSNVTQL